MSSDIRHRMTLSGRRIIVTGGNGHIGRALVTAFQELGARVAVMDHAKSFKKGRKRASDLPCDLSNEKQTRLMTRRGIAHLKGLDGLVHCAAFVGSSTIPGWAVPFEKQNVKAWDAALRVNLTAAFVLAQETKQALGASGRGSIVLFSSIYGLVGPDMSLYEGTTMANPAGYNASKGGLLQLTRYLSTTMAPRVRVNAISPGGVWRNQPAAFHDRYKKRTPLGRMAREEDLTGAAVYFLSDMSSYVTGQNLAVDGGWTAW